MLTKEDIKELQYIYLKELGITITTEDALKEGLRIIKVMEIIIDIENRRNL